jgi:hypothetical protein
MSVLRAAPHRRELLPVPSRERWIACGLALQMIGIAIPLVGAVVLARPFVRRVSTLLIAVPLAAVVGLAVFGVIALVLAAVIVTFDDGSPDLLANLLPGDWPTRRRRR